MAVAPGEIIHVPDSGYNIGGGYEVMVLYADEERITFHVGNSDKLDGYVMHLEDVCTEPDLLALYEALNDNGRTDCPFCVVTNHWPCLGGRDQNSRSRQRSFPRPSIAQ